MARLVEWTICIAAVALVGSSLSAQDTGDGLLPAASSGETREVMAVRKALMARDAAGAEKSVETMNMRNPASFDSLFWKGFVAMRRGMYLDAIRAFRQAERIDARPAVLKTLAVSYYWAHQKKLFLLKMNEALKKDPGDFAPHYYLGRYYDSDVAEFARAAEYLRQAIERRPDHLESHYYLGHSYEAQQMPEQAEALYRKVLALKKADNLANQGLARLRLAAGKAEEALTFALTAKEAASNDPGPRKLLARVYADLGRDAAAAGEWKAAAELDPTDAVPLYRLYRAYAAMGRSTEADAVLAEYKKVAARWGSGN